MSFATLSTLLTVRTQSFIAITPHMALLALFKLDVHLGTINRQKEALAENCPTAYRAGLLEKRRRVEAVNRRLSRRLSSAVAVKKPDQRAVEEMVYNGT